MPRPKKGKAGTPTADDSNKPSNSGPVEIPTGGAPSAENGGDASKNPYVRDIEKYTQNCPFLFSHDPRSIVSNFTRFSFCRRIAKINKKKRQIELVEQKIAHLSEDEKKTTTLINKDERAKVSGKAAIMTQLQEYTEILNSMIAIGNDEEKARASEKSAGDADASSKLEAAKAEGKQEGIKEQRIVLQTLLKFLRLAGYRRATSGGEQAENEAIEKVLVMVYSNEESAIEAAHNIAFLSTKVIEETDGITCKLHVFLNI